jgi:cadmium resistance protein CadD (predicted permease)
MSDILLAILVSVIAFLATNLENQLILLAYLHHPRYSVQAILAGYVGATGLILLASYGFSRLVQLLPKHSIHYLGLLPITLGIWELLKLLFSSKTSSASIDVAAQDSRKTKGGGILRPAMT